MKYQQYEFDYHQMKQIVNYAIEQFETLLDKYNIILPNPEKEGAGEGTSNIFGTDHGNLMDNITFEIEDVFDFDVNSDNVCLLYTSPSPRDRTRSRMPSSA